jgi:GT2 family glycosyltransferase
VEQWFADAPPAGDELASILILCCNELDYTRLCLESVVRHTRPPYEIVLVDNGSTDGTPAFLEQFQAAPLPAGRPGQLPERVTVLRNATNRGFAAGCNQALARGRGQYLVFLNNDTVVTAGWLDGLVRWVLHDWPNIGLVGPVSNCTAAPQQVAIDYADLSGLDDFAARRRRDHAGTALTAGRLTGFCLLVRRDVLDTVGGFDERYGVGFFEDDDLCARARRAGFQPAVAQDVFIHHFGSRTFKGLGINCAQQVAENFARFKEKWGTEEAARYRLPGEGASAQKNGAAPQPEPVIPAQPTAGRPRVSL